METNVKLKENSKIAVACRGGPINGPYSARVFATLSQGLRQNGQEIHGIYAISGSCPTALFGCIGEEERLCEIWLHLTPKDIVGDKEELDAFIKLIRKFENESLFSALLKIRPSSDISNVNLATPAIRRLKDGYIFSNEFLYQLIKKHASPYLDRIFGPEAILMKIGAVDYLTGQQVIFSNKILEHKDHLFGGVVASMGIVPSFNSFVIDNPIELKLTEAVHFYFNSVLLIDGGYRATILLEQAIREPIGYDVIFLVDINGFKIEQIRPDALNPNIVSRIQRSDNIASTSIDQLTISLTERASEEVEIKDDLQEYIIDELRRYIDEHGDPTGKLTLLLNRMNEKLLDRMNEGRLHLIDKHAPKLVYISSPEKSIPFDFTNFTQREIAYLQQVGHHAALKALKELGLNVKGIPLIEPSVIKS